MLREICNITSCGGVVIFRGKILLLYKNYKNKYEGWVLPKGTVEPGEEYRDTAAREVREETGVDALIIKYVGKSQYSFTVPDDTICSCNSYTKAKFFREILPHHHNSLLQSLQYLLMWSVDFRNSIPLFLISCKIFLYLEKYVATIQPPKKQRRYMLASMNSESWRWTERRFSLRQQLHSGSSPAFAYGLGLV